MSGSRTAEGRATDSAVPSEDAGGCVEQDARLGSDDAPGFGRKVGRNAS